MTYDIDAVRGRFPALALSHGAADERRPRIYLDNPAGTQVPDVVLDRMRRAMVECNANMHGEFHTSREATDLVDQAHLAAADLYNAASEREIVFGANMTTLTFMLTRVLGPRFEPGDELITTHMEHEGNNTPWRRMAEERGMVVKTLPFDATTYEFDLAELDSLITERTRFAAFNHASNLLGTINPIKQMAAKVKAAGGLVFVDSVQYAPHGPLDVQDLGVDLLVSSSYKWYGPHQGVLWGREELLAGLRAYHLRTVADVLPDKFETGTQSLEGQAGVIGATEYLQWLAGEFGASHDLPGEHLRPRTRQLHAALRAMVEYEKGLSLWLIEGLQSIDGAEVRGITDPNAVDRRVPTVSFTVEGLDPADIARWLDEHGIYVWNGHSYALPVVEFLGLADKGGVVRVGPTHYNTRAEIDTAVGVIADYVTSHR